MNDLNFDWLKNHSDQFLAMAFRTDRDERLYNPDAQGKNTGDCGDSIEIFLTIRHGKISAISFQIDGCINTRACANALGDMVQGKRPAQAWKITPEAIAEALETLPEESYHCAELAAGALYRALRQYQAISRNSWKKSYLSQ
jgi:nitrogen fixation protein NifU and related proteins